MSEPYRVMFVCTGNICRSPMAAWVLRHHLLAAGLDGDVRVDSAGTGGWHVGGAADRRTVEVLRRHGYGYEHVARQFQPDWFEEYDLIIGLDEGHLWELRRMARDGEAVEKIRLLREFDPAADDGDLDIPDPYYGGVVDFEEVRELIEAAVPGLIEEIRKEIKERR